MTALAPEFPRSLFAHKPFAFFWSARVMSTIAFQLQGVAVGWQIYALTHSALALGMVGLVQFLPMLGLTLVVGHVADRYDRRRIIALCQLVEGLGDGLSDAGQHRRLADAGADLRRRRRDRRGAGLRDALDAGADAGAGAGLRLPARRRRCRLGDPDRDDPRPRRPAGFSMCWDRRCPTASPG